MESQTRTVRAGGGASPSFTTSNGQRQAHFLRQRGEVRSRQVAVAVVDAVQVLDQQVAAAGGVAQQPPHVLEGLGVDRSALRAGADFAFHGALYYQPARDRDS